ncbi:Zn-ribbon domain-containing OB-fold protein [Croceicoccus gelatinilyticus]|uniref:Zn-ribbon domain-containing OB-fold protein n=1 Tax=Croceicoccus gelatinilyticus TaxID=2835536 RepID=UPI001BCB2B88|nr:OB-fold domain-containing protein [Croceicoccus gelatinilyticus]
MKGPEAEWREALAEGRLLLQRTADGKAVFPPRVAAPGTGEGGLEWFEASGRGTIYSLTWVQRRPPQEPYNVVLVDLDEGARLMSRVEDVAPDTLEIGQEVEAYIDRSGEEPVLLFRLARGAS